MKIYWSSLYNDYVFVGFEDDVDGVYFYSEPWWSRYRYDLPVHQYGLEFIVEIENA